MLYIIKEHKIVSAFVASVIATALLLFSYLLAEPQVMIAADTASDTFTIEQTITGEISFVAPTNDVTMSPTIGGLVGGLAQGTTTVLVRTNNPTGYNMTIHFASTTSMIGDTQSGYVPNYAPAVPGDPDVNFAIPAGSSGFAYSVFPDDADDAVEMFEVNTTCNNGAGTPTLGSCWYNQANASNTVTIIDRPDATPGTGATTTISFRVGVDANPSPALPTDTYTATATLTATEN